MKAKYNLIFKPILIQKYDIYEITYDHKNNIFENKFNLKSIIEVNNYITLKLLSDDSRRYKYQIQNQETEKILLKFDLYLNLSQPVVLTVYTLNFTKKVWVNRRLIGIFGYFDDDIVLNLEKGKNEIILEYYVKDKSLCNEIDISLRISSYLYESAKTLSSLKYGLLCDNSNFIYYDNGYSCIKKDRYEFIVFKKNYLNGKSKGFNLDITDNKFNKLDSLYIEYGKKVSYDISLWKSTGLTDIYFLSHDINLAVTVVLNDLNDYIRESLEKAEKFVKENNSFYNKCFVDEFVSYINLEKLGDYEKCEAMDHLNSCIQYFYKTNKLIKIKDLERGIDDWYISKLDNGIEKVEIIFPENFDVQKKYGLLISLPASRHGVQCFKAAALNRDDIILQTFRSGA